MGDRSRRQLQWVARRGEGEGRGYVGEGKEDWLTACPDGDPLAGVLPTCLDQEEL